MVFCCLLLMIKGPNSTAKQDLKSIKGLAFISRSALQNHSKKNSSLKSDTFSSFMCHEPKVIILTRNIACGKTTILETIHHTVEMIQLLLSNNHQKIPWIFLCLMWQNGYHENNINSVRQELKL